MIHFDHDRLLAAAKYVQAALRKRLSPETRESFRSFRAWDDLTLDRKSLMLQTAGAVGDLVAPSTQQLDTARTWASLKRDGLCACDEGMISDFIEYMESVKEDQLALCGPIASYPPPSLVDALLARLEK